MKFLLGAITGAVVVGGAGLYLLAQLDEEPVRFPTFQMMVLDDYVHLEGSLYGEGEDRPVDNFYSIKCRQERQECEITSVDQIGSYHLGPFNQESIPITEWTDTKLVASSKAMVDDTQGCNYYQVTMDLIRETATYERWPREEAGESCRNFFEEKVMRWRFDNGRAWSDNADGSKRP